jgi:hypothetical protein
MWRHLVLQIGTKVSADSNTSVYRNFYTVSHYEILYPLLRYFGKNHSKNARPNACRIDILFLFHYFSRRYTLSVAKQITQLPNIYKGKGKAVPDFYFYCCTVHFDNIKIFFTKEWTLYQTYKMSKFTIKTSMHSLLHVSVHLDHPQGAYAEHTLYSTRYTHYRLKLMLPQHCKTFNDVFYW